MYDIQLFRKLIQILRFGRDAKAIFFNPDAYIDESDAFKSSQKLVNGYYTALRLADRLNINAVDISWGSKDDTCTPASFFKFLYEAEIFLKLYDMLPPKKENE